MSCASSVESVGQLATCPRWNESNRKKEGRRPEEPTKRGRGRLVPRAGIPKRLRPKLPLVSGKRYSQISVGCLSAQRGGGPKDPGVRW